MKNGFKGEIVSFVPRDFGIKSLIYSCLRNFLIQGHLRWNRRSHLECALLKVKRVQRGFETNA